MIEDFLEDIDRGGFWFAVGQTVIRFRWKHDLRRVKELWLDDLPPNHCGMIHSYAVDTSTVQGIGETLALGEVADLVDEHEFFETVKVLGHSGLTNEELSFLKYKPISGMVDGYCILLPAFILQKCFETEDSKLSWNSTDRKKVPFTVILHYGNGEKPYWMEESWIKAHTDPDYYRNNDWDPFNPHFQQGFSHGCY